jgi:hypothetical protein
MPYDIIVIYIYPGNANLTKSEKYIIIPFLMVATLFYISYTPVHFMVGQR